MSERDAQDGVAGPRAGEGESPPAGPRTGEGEGPPAGPLVSDPASAEQVVVFEVGSRRCCLPLGEVLEVVHLGPVTRVAAAPAAVAGAVNVRGRVVAILDLGLLLEGIATAPRPGDPGLLVAAAGYEVVVQVSRVHQVTDIDPRARLGGGDRAGLVGKVLATPGGPAHLIDLQQVLRRVVAEIVGERRRPLLERGPRSSEGGR